MKQTKQVELQKLIESHVTNPSVQKHMIELSIQSQQEAVERERERIVKKHGFKEALPTHVNDREIDKKNPLLQFIKGRDSVRKELREALQQEQE